MKRLKNIFLSALLFSFTFLIFHDYVINEISPSSQNSEMVSISYEKINSSTISSALQAHENIHAFVALSLANNHISPCFTFHSRPLDTETQVSFFSSYVLERPPLS